MIRLIVHLFIMLIAVNLGSGNPLHAQGDAGFTKQGDAGFAEQGDAGFAEQGDAGFAEQGDAGFAEQGDAGLEGISVQKRVYFNARIAQREGRSTDVLRLWLLHNALKSRGEPSIYEADFRSVLWAALGDAGFCHDGLRYDDEKKGGAGLWPLALHNWVNRSSSRQDAPEQPRAFTSFSSEFQQRHFSLHDVLSKEELQGARFYRNNCRAIYFTLPRLRSPHWLFMKNRLSRGIVMRDLIEKAQETLQHERVLGEVVLEVRHFDLELALIKLAKAESRRKTGFLSRLAKQTGVSESAMTLVRERRLKNVRASNYTDLLRRSLFWPITDWQALRLDRRMALFAEARQNYQRTKSLQAPLLDTYLANIDALIEAKDGDALNIWLGFAAVEPFQPADAQKSPADDQKSRQNATKKIPTWALQKAQNVQSRKWIEALVLGNRGKRLLSLTPDSGFRERGAVALRRGVHFLSIGKNTLAMRSFALALKRAEESSSSESVHTLSKRWFAYVLMQHEATDEILAILNEFILPRVRNELLEILLWRAAFATDLQSFTRIEKGMQKGGSAAFRAQQLRILAKGNAGAMYLNLYQERKKQPHALYNFVRRVVQELSLESLDVRLKNRATLENGLRLLQRIPHGKNRGLQKRIAKLNIRIQTLLNGLRLYDESAIGRARDAAPNAESYAGSVRLAPADVLPWPFSMPQIQAPSPFVPIRLSPVEWISDEGERIFGWQVHE